MFFITILSSCGLLFITEEMGPELGVKLDSSVFIPTYKPGSAISYKINITAGDGYVKNFYISTNEFELDPRSGVNSVLPNGILEKEEYKYSFKGEIKDAEINYRFVIPDDLQAGSSFTIEYSVEATMGYEETDRRKVKVVVK